MAEVLVNVLLERLATITLDKVGGEFKLVTGVEKEVKSLTSNLEAIQAVLEDAEQRQVTEVTVRRWLSELTEVSFDMDDVLDEWITEVLKQQMEKQEKQKKVCFPLLSSCSCFRFGQVNQLFLRQEIATKIKELNERLASIDERKQSFGFQNTTRVPELPRQKTTSLPNVKTFGRDNEKKLIVSELLSESSEGNEVPLIIPIVGMGGMGKTTLAQLVCNDEEVKSHFDKRIWVCVSDPFEEIKIAQAIIEEIDKDNSSKSSNVLQTLTQCINKLIEGKKFLLVLDDVWSPNSDQWEELIKPLRNGALGSRVLVTTRKEEVADLMKATTQMISLKALNDAFCLSLFYYSANMDENNVSKEFHDIGLEIVKRCSGLPLAAKTLGSLMRNKRKIHEWRDVLNSKTWELEKIQQDVFRPLLLSYHDLTPATKRCLLYCVIFPKDYVYNRNDLIKLWMSQDYLNAKESKEKIIVGQNYFDDLAMRSFFQDIKVHDDEYEKITCKIHDIVHDFLKYLTKDECLILDFELDASERRDVSKDKVHHLTLVHATEGDSLKSFLPNYKKLRTLVARESSENSIGPVFELIVQLRCLRTLSLCGRWMRQGCLKEIPETIGGLIHLRYLDLSFNQELKELPSALGSLYNLQTLRLDYCSSLKEIPGTIGGLIHLRHLELSCNWHLKELPSALGSLYNLQTLRLANCSSLKEIPETIGGLIHLRYLDLSVNRKLKELPSALSGLSNLQTLRLVGCSDLKKVDVRRLINLRHLYVKDCDDLELIKGIEKLTELQRLDEFRVGDGDGDGDGDEGNKLEHLKDLNQLQGSLSIEIRGNPENAAAIMVNKAHLLQLKLQSEPFVGKNHREIMNALEPHPGLESLIIRGYGGGAFSHWLSNLHCLRLLTLQGWPRCGFLPPLGKLASLESLHIDHLRVSKVGVEFLGIDDGQTSSSSSSIFPKLKQLTFNDMEFWEEWEGVENNNNITIMPCLSQLTIDRCEKLNSLPDFLWKTPLQKLHIKYSPTLEHLYRQGIGEQRAKISRIPTIKIGHY